MKRVTFLFCIFLFLTNAKGQTYIQTFESPVAEVTDSFEIYTSLPENYNEKDTYHIFYYFDANLKSGKALREAIRDKKYENKTSQTIFVGIGHFGDFHQLRRRDFILPFIHGTDTIPKSKQYGHIKDFYTLLTTAIMPIIESKYHIFTADRSILGHSLGGLFVFYSMFQNDTFFTHFYALSPALWIDKSAIYRFNYLQSGLKNPSDIYYSCGSKERMNHIKKGVKKMNRFLENKKYQNLKYTMAIYKGKNHNSQVKLSLDYILSH